MVGYRAAFVFPMMMAFAACGGTDAMVREPRPHPPVTTSASGTSAPSPVSAAKTSLPATVVKLDADTPLATPGGSTFIGPNGWSVTTSDGIVTLEDPNKEVSVVFLERKEAEGGAAIAAAWKQINPGFSRQIKLTRSWPGRKGWDAAVEFEYQTNITEAREVFAHAARKGDTWYVMLFDGTMGGWQRRWPQADIARTSFRAKGVVEETFRGKKAHVLDAARLRDLETFIENGRQAAQIPGLAVAIIQGGKVVYEKGFGVRSLKEKKPVTPNTMFRIASMSKPLTSLLMGILVDEGKFTWETPATQILPTFALGSAELTKRLRMRDVVCACTGIPYDNVATDFEYDGLTAEKMIERMKEVKPTTGFGETFQYSNAMVAVGGFLAAHTEYPKKPMAQAYEQAMQVKVFNPLGMTSTTFDRQKVKKGEFASSHMPTLAREMVETPFDSDGEAIALTPAGGAWSTVRDLSKYLLMELANGKSADGKQVISEKNLLARREPQARTGEDISYGLALSIDSSQGVRRYGHNGGLWGGYTSAMFFLPEHGVAALMLGNGEFPSPFVYQAFKRKLYEVLFDGRDEAREDLALALESMADAAKKEASTIDTEPDAAWLATLVGTYEHSLYGKLVIRTENGKGIIDVGEWKSPFGRIKDPTGAVKIALTAPSRHVWPRFVPREVDGKMTLRLDGGDVQRLIVFERVKDEK